MKQVLIALILSSLMAAASAHAAEEPKEKSKSGNKVERTLDKAGKAVTKTVEKVEKSIGNAATKSTNAMQSAGKKADSWVQEKLK